MVKDARVRRKKKETGNEIRDPHDCGCIHACRPIRENNVPSSGHRADAPFRSGRRFRTSESSAGLYRECRRHGHRPGDRLALAADRRRRDDLEHARDYRAVLTLGGKSGWRLPSNQELFSILNHNNGKPAIDTSAFTRTEAEYWWSSETRADDASRIWSVNAGGGTGPHPKRETISAGGEKHYHARCVIASVSTPIREPYTANGDGTVTDNRTGLIWQQGETSPMTWEEALKYANSLSLAGRSDWRLPNIKELESLNNEKIVAPSIPKTHFPLVEQDVYWSSTTLVNHPTRAWTVDFTFGIASYEEKTEKLRVRAVQGKP